MSRRTPPAGYPLHRPRSQAEDWDEDVTHAGMTDEARLAVHLRRAQKLSEASSLAKAAHLSTDVLERDFAGLRADHLQLGRTVSQIREDQLKLLYLTEQLEHELASIRASSQEHAKEAGAWKRQLLQSLIAACAVGVSFAAIFARKC